MNAKIGIKRIWTCQLCGWVNISTKEECYSCETLKEVLNDNSRNN